jgi:putative oxidoreductase
MMNTTAEATAAPRSQRSVADNARCAIRWLEQVSYETLISTPARIFIATTFWLSGRTKVEEGLTLSQSALFLFEYEYALPIIPPRFAAYLATYAEHLFPILLIVGLGSRLSATALLAMTAVIQFFVYPGAWSTHLLWASVLAWIIFRGPGQLSIDHWIRERQSS